MSNYSDDTYKWLDRIKVKFKDGLKLKIKDIHLYFKATKYLYNNDPVEYIGT